MNLQAPSGSATAAHPIRRVAKVAALSLLRLRYVLRRTPDEFIFINCPARSGSTLLSNILCGHPQICGFGETMMTYRSSADLPALVAQVYWGNRQFRVRERYVLEKIVHNRLLPDPKVLNNAAISWIFMLRDPAAALCSYMELHNKSEAQALDYYLKRLPRLQSDARHYASQQHRAYFLSYEQLVAEPQSMLNALSRFLGLNGSLTPLYVRPRVHNMSAGDQSERIKVGQVVAKPRRYHVEISSASLEQARAAHAECEAVLRSYCESVVDQRRRETMADDASVQ